MVSPSQKRRAAKHLVHEMKTSVRKACVVVGITPSSYYYNKITGEFEKRLIKELHILAKKHPRFGYRRMTMMLNRTGWNVNKKRIQRLMRTEGLKITKKAKKRKRQGNSTVELQTANHPNHVWSWDFIFDRLENGGALKFLVIMDEYTKQILRIRTAKNITSNDVIQDMMKLINTHGRPEFIRSDNGPEFIAKALAKWLETFEIGTIYIEPGSPWENPYIESFNSKFRDECLNREMFTCLLEARVIVNDFADEYNEIRPHSSLDYMTPTEFVYKWKEEGIKKELKRIV